jgi:hypothetical protein
MQLVWPAVQFCMQFPLRQNWPAAQACPQDPQLLMLVLKLVQVLLQGAISDEQIRYSGSSVLMGFVVAVVTGGMVSGIVVVSGGIVPGGVLRVITST